ncbi:MAG TPA: Ada metal-binding domain-containing protein, partial [Thioalkalivibrio sp.]|nr:Ada metal-binding domain-containing protein [Thioalkalivibrio sp.]
METRPLPSADEMYAALLARDAGYDGIFLVGVRSTGIFCRPTCPARKPMRRNVEFYSSAREALAHG